MKLLRMDHVGIVVNDLAAAKAFFLDLGLTAGEQWVSENEMLDKIVALKNVKTEAVMLTLPDGQTKIELIKYHSPSDDNGIQPSFSNTLGIRHFAFPVDDIEAVVAHLKEKGVEFFSAIQSYDNTYKLCYCRGPEGIILELAQEIK